MTIRSYAILGICFLLVSGTFGCIDIFPYQTQHQYNILSYNFTISVNTNTSANYTLHVPIMIWKTNGTEAGFVMRALQIVNGTGHFNLTDTEHGHALVLNSSNSITIEAKGVEDIGAGYPPRLSLSMESYSQDQDLGNVKHYINCLKSDMLQGITVEIVLETYYNGTGESDLIYESYSPTNGTLENGWQVIDGYASIVVH